MDQWSAARAPSTRSTSGIRNLLAWTNSKNDVIRLIVRASIGAYVRIAFLLPKDQFVSMSKRQIYDLISPAITMPPLYPPHPANTVVDLKPAAPGFAPMHATETAHEGCWWVPFRSEK